MEQDEEMWGETSIWGFLSGEYEVFIVLQQDPRASPIDQYKQSFPTFIEFLLEGSDHLRAIWLGNDLARPHAKVARRMRGANPRERLAYSTSSSTHADSPTCAGPVMSERLGGQPHFYSLERKLRSAPSETCRLLANGTHLAQNPGLVGGAVYERFKSVSCTLKASNAGQGALSLLSPTSPVSEL